MKTLFTSIIDLSVMASWLIGAVIIVRFLLKKAPASWRGLLWVLVGIRLLCPVSFESNLSLVPERSTVKIVEFEEQEIPMMHGTESEVTMENSKVEVPEVTTPITEEPTVKKSFDYTALFSWIWAVGMTGMLVHAAISYRKIRRKADVSIQHEKRVWICDDIQTPFILGIIRPRIYIPSTMDPETMQYVLAHENAHIQRKDHWWKPLGYLILTVYWFNPLVWLAYILMCRDIELACDEKVVVKLDAAQKKAYSGALLSCSIPRKMIAACPVAFGEVGVKMRVRSILNYKKPAFWLVVVMILAVIGVGVFFGTKPKEVISVDSIPDVNWGVELQVKDITKSGATILCTQSGGEPTGELSTGSYFVIERWEKNQWAEVEPEAYSIAWTMEGWIIPMNDTIEWPMDWSWIYGELPKGTYRIGKEIMDFRGTGDFDEAMHYAEFTITGREKSASESSEDPSDFTVQMEEVFIPEYIELVGHNFAQYLDMDSESIREALESAGLTIIDMTKTEIPNAYAWVVKETFNGWERETELNLSVYGDSDQIRLSQYNQRYTYTEDFQEENKKMISDVYDESFAAFGIPCNIGEKYQYKYKALYERAHFDIALNKSQRLIKMQMVWQEPEFMHPGLTMDISAQYGQKGAQIYLVARSKEAIEYMAKIVD